MSFSLDTKNELSHVKAKKKCCTLAEIAGFLRVAGSISLVGFGKFNIKVVTENAAIARHYKELIQDYFDIETSLAFDEGYSVKRKSAAKNVSYVININYENKSEQILRECGFLLVKEGSNYISDGIYFGVVHNKCCKKAYLRGVFLGAGTMANPEKSYDLEYVVGSETLANDLKKLIGSFVDLQAKVIKRGNKYVVYMKKGDYISDILALMGADTQVLKFENIRITKGVKKTARCATNCDMANSDRTTECALRQIQAIEKIANTVGLVTLSSNLFEMAQLRIQHPESSIEALGELCDPPLKKSGVNSRLRRLEEIAAKL